MAAIGPGWDRPLMTWACPPVLLADPGAVVEAQTSVPYAIVGGILALLVFLIICVLVGMVWCSVRQKGEWGRGLKFFEGCGWLWRSERGGA